MRKNITKHYLHYLVYAAIFGAGLVLILVMKGNTSMQATLLIMTAFIYFMWSMVHHYVHHELHPRVVVEYILMVVLGTTLMLFLFGI